MAFEWCLKFENACVIVRIFKKVLYLGRGFDLLMKPDGLLTRQIYMQCCVYLIVGRKVTKPKNRQYFISLMDEFLKLTDYDFIKYF
jgi:hypothetical protein